MYKKTIKWFTETGKQSQQIIKHFGILILISVLNLPTSVYTHNKTCQIDCSPRPSIKKDIVHVKHLSYWVTGRNERKVKNMNPLFTAQAAVTDPDAEEGGEGGGGGEGELLI